MATVYMLQGSSGRFYIGATENLQQRIKKHNSGPVYSTKRLGLPLQIAGSIDVASMSEARSIERKLKSWKNPKKALEYLSKH